MMKLCSGFGEVLRRWGGALGDMGPQSGLAQLVQKVGYILWRAGLGTRRILGTETLSVQNELSGKHGLHMSHDESPLGLATWTWVLFSKAQLDLVLGCGLPKTQVSMQLCKAQGKEWVLVMPKSNSWAVSGSQTLARGNDAYVPVMVQSNCIEGL